MTMLRLALRSLLAHPLRSGVLAVGFGLGVSVMANLLGIGQVMLEQVRAPALAGGGDLVVAGDLGEVPSARYILSGVMETPPLRGRARAASPSRRSLVYLVPDEGAPVAVEARGGIPSLERALGDTQTAGVAAWTDTDADRAWVSPDTDDVVRAMDRFHAIPDAPEWADGWAEWLYFNGRAGQTRFYLTFLVGPMRGEGRRAAGVRLQLDDDGRFQSFSEFTEVDAAEVLSLAPDLTIGRSQVRLADGHYRMSLDLPSVDVASGSDDAAGASRVTGEIALEARRGRSLPPLTVRGARGWMSGYTVPVMAAALEGQITVDGNELSLDGGSGYHDHNWGHWAGVSWQWGQVQGEDLSFVYGRVHPPSDAADAARIPGFLMVIGADGPIGYATRLSMEEEDDPETGEPRRIVVQSRGDSVALRLEVDVEDVAMTRMDRERVGAGLDFYQLRARVHVTGRVGDRSFDFIAPGSAETFRGR
ncbi:MAG: hypothetical protein CL477_13425 [Acidobacteria bacterium]|jgi:hypothetical protein|nr:hypothetical protein [Acidobacteriota bacterium]MDP7339607.1 hypothetical protein [Vicinamibacterales bacterium]MDP7480263.1 hypothetical protein [Vicinamibacterales bacterium]HJN46061.1 hypothetical protein [Vicinamibacterales bacterium]|tara:strand:+ start:1152 stop:2579 length:1428 start_codon:yes stop_codon:yes gene_type:complete